MTDNKVNIDIDLSNIEEFFESVERAQGVVIYTAPYALYVEVDTSYDRGLKPPFKPLFEWTKRNITSDEDEARGIAFAIQQNIFENGIEGEFYLTTTKSQWKTKWKDVAEQIELDNNVDAPEILVENILEGILDDSNRKLEQKDKIDTGNLRDSGTVILGLDSDGRNVDKIEI